MKTTWWYESAIFDSDHTTVAMARLLVRDDGTAQVLTDGAEILEFTDEHAAGDWLITEEYNLLDNLVEELTEQGRTDGSRIKPPETASDAELYRHMVLKLDGVSAHAPRLGAETNSALKNGQPTSTKKVVPS